MADNTSSKVCEVEADACKKEARALCFHCSKNLCRVHLMQHAQLVEEQTRTELHSLADKLNELSSKFNNLLNLDDIFQKPLDQLEKWRVEAHEKIDQIVESKRQELDRCRKVFLKKNEQQLVKLNDSKKVLAELIQEADASAKQIADLQGSIEKAQKYLNTRCTPVINAIVQSSNRFVNICKHFFDRKTTWVNNLRKFKIIYVRLNGIIRTYFIMAQKDGKMSDLEDSFVQQYRYYEEFSKSTQSSINTINHEPKCDFILPTEIYNHSIYLQFADDGLLNNIRNRDMVVFYETPYSMIAASLCILMPCLFECNTDRKGFGVPIYLSVPRKGCRGQDVRDALHDTLSNFFPPNLNIKQLSYDTYLESTVNYPQKRTELDDVLQDEIDFTKVHTTLIVAFDSEFVKTYERYYLEHYGF